MDIYNRENIPVPVPVNWKVKDTNTVCPGSSDPFYTVTYNIKWGHYFLDTRYVKFLHKKNFNQKYLYKFSIFW